MIVAFILNAPFTVKIILHPPPPFFVMLSCMYMLNLLYLERKDEFFFYYANDSFAMKISRCDELERDKPLDIAEEVRSLYIHSM